MRGGLCSASGGYEDQGSGLRIFRVSGAQLEARQIQQSYLRDI